MTDEAPKRPRGRPTGTGKYRPGKKLVPEPEYNKNMLTDMYDMMKEGRFDCQIYAKWNVRKETFYSWKREHSEFKEAHDRGLGACEAWWMEEQRKHYLAGDESGFKYCAMIMNNKFGWHAKDGRNSDTQININNLNVLPSQSKQELLAYIKDELTLNNDIIELNDSEYKLLESREQDSSGTGSNSSSSEDSLGEEKV